MKTTFMFIFISYCVCFSIKAAFYVFYIINWLCIRCSNPINFCKQEMDSMHELL